MQATCRAALGLPGLVFLILLPAGCGQNEGGRCQISSDCASGLRCSDTSGNGTCQPEGFVRRDAAPDLTSSISNDVAEPAEVGADAEPAAPDAVEPDTVVEPDTGTESEAGVIDAMTPG